MHSNLKKLRRILPFLLAVTMLCSCAVIPDASSGISVTDASGASVTVPVQPKRVAVLFSSFADIWVTAGGSVAITVGESVERGFADSSAILVDDAAGKTIDTERLISAEPDLVICSADIPAQVTAAELCKLAGIPAVVFQVEAFTDYLSLLSLFTQLTGQPERYAQYGTAVSDEISTMKAEYLENAQFKSILFIRASSSAKSTKAKTAEDHFACRMLKELGTDNIAEAAPVLLDGLSFEEILIQDPDFIFISAMGSEEAAISYMESVLQQPQWQSLSAVQNKQVIYLPKDLFQFKPNSRWNEAYAYLIDALSVSR